MPEPVRSKRSDIRAKLYDRNLASPTFVEDLTPRMSKLKFSTKLHGGFDICKLEVAMGWNEGWKWFNRDTGYWFYRLVVSDSKKTLFEGRLEDITLIERGVKCVFLGYFSACGDQPYSTAFNAIANTVIKAILTAVCPDISSDQSNIAATNVTIASVSADEDLYLCDLITRLANYSDSNKYTWYFAVWEDRIPYFFARSISTIDWKTRREYINNLRLRCSTKELWNKIYAEYIAAGARTRTAASTDSDSVSQYGITREKAVVSLDAVAEAAAIAQRDWFLEEHKDIWPQTTGFVIGDFVQNANGVVFPSCHIRAGEVIRIIDLVPATVDLDAVTRNALNTFYIKETTYDYDAGEMTIVPDTADLGLEAQMARDLQLKGTRSVLS